MSRLCKSLAILTLLALPAAMSRYAFGHQCPSSKFLAAVTVANCGTCTCLCGTGVIPSDCGPCRNNGVNCPGCTCIQDPLLRCKLPDVAGTDVGICLSCY